MSWVALGQGHDLYTGNVPAFIALVCIQLRQAACNMRFNSVLSIAALVCNIIATPVPSPSKALATRDGPTFVKAWTDLGNAFLTLDNAFKSVNQALLRPFGSSQVPAAHNTIMTLMQQEANYISTQNQALGMLETGTLLGPAQKLTTQATAALKTIQQMKPIAVRSGERDQVGQMLKQQSDAYTRWEATLNKLVPAGQKSFAHSFATPVISGYAAAVKLYATD